MVVATQSWLLTLTMVWWPWCDVAAVPRRGGCVCGVEVVRRRRHPCTYSLNVKKTLEKKDKEKRKEKNVHYCALVSSPVRPSCCVGHRGRGTRPTVNELDSKEKKKSKKT